MIINMNYGYIYIIENDLNDKVYVGQTTNPELRKFAHLGGSSGCPLIRNTIKKYGRSHFDFVIIEVCVSLHQLNEREKYWVSKLGTLSPGGYNLTSGGEGMGFPSEETRDKLSHSKRGKNSPWWGKTLSDAHKEKLSHAKLGKKLSEDHKKKLSDSHKGLFSGDNHPLYGKSVSEETRLKISLSKRGKKLSTEHKRKIGEANKKSWKKKTQKK